MEIGIIGLPNVGKSTLFNTLTNSNIPAENFPFTTIEPNIGVCAVEDFRLKELARIFGPSKITPVTVKFVDIAGLIKDSHKGAGLGNKFLSYVRNVDALLQVIRAFPDEKIVNAYGKFDPVEEIEIVETELILADLELAIKSKEKLSGLAHSGNKEAKEKILKLENVIKFLNQNKPLRNINDSGELEQLKEYNFLTTKSVLYLLNISELTQENVIQTSIQYIQKKKMCEETTLNVQIEYEISLFETEQEKLNFRKELGFKTDINELIIKAYKLLNLITFYTIVGGKELRAWPLLSGTDAKSASGKIHSDMEKGFISVEVYSYSDIIKYVEEKVLREKGIIKTESKNYIVRDGDILNIHFSK